MTNNEITLSVGTWNIGAGTMEDANRILNKVAVLAMQEASDRDSMFDTLREKGYGVIRPDQHVGQPATPLVFNKDRLKLLSRIVVPLYHGGPIGPGTGPDNGKPKWLIGAKFMDKKTNIRLAFGSIHCYAGQKDGNARRRISTDMVAKARDSYDRYRGIPFIMGDFNAEADTSTLHPLRNRGWHTDSIQNKKLGTHGGWTPDQVWWRHDPKVRFDGSETVKNRSDHDALIAHLVLRPDAE